MNAQKIILLGGGGHAQSLLAILDDVGVQVIGYADHAPTGLEVTYLGTDEDVLTSHMAEQAGCCIAVGLNVPLRRKLYERFRAASFSFPTCVHPRAYLAPTARLGLGVVVYPGVFVGANVQVERNVHVCAGSIIEHGAHIGAHTYVAPRAAIAGNVTIGPECLVGISATIIDGLIVARATTVGAGGVLTHSVAEPGGIYVGVPARRREVQCLPTAPGEPRVA